METADWFETKLTAGFRCTKQTHPSVRAVYNHFTPEC